MEQQIHLRNIKLKQYIFELSDSLPPTVRGITMPTGRYLVAFADYLNQLLLLVSDPNAFRDYFRESQLQATEEVIQSALQVSSLKFAMEYSCYTSLPFDIKYLINICRLGYMENSGGKRERFSPIYC